MLKKLLLLFGFEMALALIILMITQADFSFHTSEAEPLTEELIKTSQDLSYNQNYVIDHPMRYLVKFESEDGQNEGTLIWVKEPYGRYLVFVPYINDEELVKKQRFEGQLIRCVYKCMAGEMYIEMFEFVEMLEKNFPALKGKYSKLPAIILDTSKKPLGWDGYFQLTRIYWIVFAVMSVMATGLFTWSLFSHSLKK